MTESVSSERLLRLLENEDPTVRRVACEILGTRGDSKACSPIRKCLRDKEWQVREAAARALGAIGEPRWADALIEHLALGDNLRPFILGVLTNGGEAAAAQAASGKSADAETQAEVIHAACLALAHLRPSIATDPLLGLLSSGNPQQIIAAAVGLGQVADESSVGAIVKVLGEVEDPQAKQALIVALGKIRSRSATPALLELLKDKSAAIRLETVIALNHIKDLTSFDGLVQCLRDSDVKVRHAAVLALGNSGQEAAIPHLIKALDDRAENVRQAALDALGATRHEVPLEAIEMLLGDEDLGVVSSAARAHLRLSSRRAFMK